MTVRLSVKTAIWRSQVAHIASSVDGLVPVVKGNGYGFGRSWLAAQAAEFADAICVGTVHEVDVDLPRDIDVVVLTPVLAPPPVSPGQRPPILTVGSEVHVAALRGWDGPVIVKLVSAMQRYGGDTSLVAAAREAGLDVVGVSVHPPLAGTDEQHRADIEARIVGVDPDLEVWVSHLTPAAFAELGTSRRCRLRLGTALWHGDKQALHLSADVVDVRPVDAGSTAGYRQAAVERAGHLVMIGAGTANGVTAPVDGRSPFHFRRRRLALHEAPHMHTSMAIVPRGDPVPEVGERVDLQRPLILTTVDEYEWL